MAAVLESSGDAPRRIGVYTDYVYRQDASGVYAERAFALFIAALRPHADRVVVIGRLDPRPGVWHYRLPDDVGFAPLGHYGSLARPGAVLAGLARAVRRFWRALDDLDAVWLLGPHPYAIVFAALAALRRRRVVLGVRQDLPRYVRSRRPGARALHLAADVLEGAWRLLARAAPVIVVGPELAERYRAGREVLAVNVSLVRAEDIVEPAEALARWDDTGELRLISVGRIDAEKNPLLLADVLARLRARDPRWRLVVCGEGPLRDALARRLDELGVADAAELPGYVSNGRELQARYRSAHAFLHVSWTEGLPQVLFEAFAAGLPVVATAVGGVPAAAGGAAILVPPGDPEAPAEALARLAADPALRERLVQAGAERVRRHTLDVEAARVAALLGAGAATADPSGVWHDSRGASD
jgi:glycosyltransferase involved in cell wall biosynthesis